MIINWDRVNCSEKIIHIHGTKDHTIPIKNVPAHNIVIGGSHMMMLTRSDQISEIINNILASM